MGDFHIIRAPMPRAKATDWVSLADIQWDGVDGTNTIESASVLLNFTAAMPSIWAALHFQSNPQLTGGAGIVRAWLRARLFDGAGGLVAAGATAPNDSFTTRFIAGAGSAVQDGLYTLRNLQPWANTVDPALMFYAQGRGSAAGTEWEVTDSRVRLLYVPA